LDLTPGSTLGAFDAVRMQTLISIGRLNARGQDLHIIMFAVGRESDGQDARENGGGQVCTCISEE
jgi:hypothetical protein